MKRFTITVGDGDTITDIKTEINVGHGWEECIGPENSPMKCVFPGKEYVSPISPRNKLLFKIIRG